MGPEPETTTDYDDLFADAEDPRTRYLLGEKLDGERIDGGYPKGRLKAIAKQYGTAIGRLEDHVAYREAALHGCRSLTDEAELVTENWGKPVYFLDLRITIAELRAALSDVQRKELRAPLRECPAAQMGTGVG